MPSDLLRRFHFTVAQSSQSHERQIGARHDKRHHHHFIVKVLNRRSDRQQKGDSWRGWGGGKVSLDLYVIFSQLISESLTALNGGGQTERETMMRDDDNNYLSFV